MPKVEITNRFTLRAICPSYKSKEVYYDTKLKGFMLEVRNNGSKTFYYQESINGKRKMIKIASSDTVANHAREQCKELKKANKKDSEQVFKRSSRSITFKNFYDNYYLPYVKTHIKSYETNISVFKNHILRELGDIKMSELKKIDVMSYHSNMIYKKNLSRGTANKFLIFLNQAYNLAHEFELLDDYNPCRGVKPYELNNQRQLFLNKTQTKRLLAEVEISPNKHLKYIIPMLLLTGARKREVLDSRWSDLDMNNMLWTIPVTKNGKKRILPITEPLQELLKQVPKQSKYLFTSAKTNKPYVSIFQSWNSARIKANLPEVRIHDLRHTYASALVNAKCSLYEVQVLLGHSTAKMTQRYAHLSNESLMRASSCAGRLLK